MSISGLGWLIFASCVWVAICKELVSNHNETDPKKGEYIKPFRVGEKFNVRTESRVTSHIFSTIVYLNILS